MEHEGSLPHSQMLAPCPYPEPARSSPCPPSNFSKIRPNRFSHLRLCLPSALFSSGFSTKIFYAALLSTTRATCPSHLILLDLISRTILGEQYRSLSSSLCSFLHSPVTSTLLRPNILLNTLFSNTLSLRSSLNVSDQVSHPYKTKVKITFGDLTYHSTKYIHKYIKMLNIGSTIFLTNT